MKKKPAADLTFKQFQKKAKDFVFKQPVLAAGVGAAGVILVFWFISSLGIFGEPREPRAAATVTVIEKGDSVIWLGMEVAPVDRTLRKDFKIPANVKGMFVINEGKELAKKYGVKTGDVIVSISRKPVPTAGSFLNAVKNIQFREGILFDICRDGKNFYMTIPFEYQYGPLVGPNKGGWQLGSPVFGQALQYGPVIR